MQIPDMYVAFGLLPPSIEQERMAQSLMAHDPGCFSFVVCKKVSMSLVSGRCNLFFFYVWRMYNSLQIKNAMRLCLR
jgi:hypothetical protein